LGFGSVHSKEFTTLFLEVRIPKTLVNRQTKQNEQIRVMLKEFKVAGFSGSCGFPIRVADKELRLLKKGPENKKRQQDAGTAGKIYIDIY
jgi:hypothetical protein